MSFNYHAIPTAAKVEIPSPATAAPAKRFSLKHIILTAVVTIALSVFVSQTVKTVKTRRTPMPAAPMALEVPMTMPFDVDSVTRGFVPIDKCQTSKSVCSGLVPVSPGAFFLVKRFCENGLKPSKCNCFGIKIDSADVPKVHRETLTEDGVCFCEFHNKAPKGATGWGMTMGCA